MPKQVDVSVNCVSGVCQVTPGEIVVNSGDTIAFTNGTGAPVHVQFSERRLFQKSLTIPSSPDPFEVVVPGPLRGCFPYSVYCESINDFATGGSMPIIIIVRG